jgi:hypothetical protein
MADLDGLIDLIPIGDIAKKLGIDPDVAQSAVQTALPAIVGGLAANAQDAGGAKSIEKALKKHTGSSGKIDVDSIDTADGEKIVSHVFGAKKNDVVAAVAKKSDNATQQIIAQILPIIAPIVLSWLASQFLNKKAAPAAKSKAKAKPKAESGGGIGDILGGLLGSAGGQEVLGSVLGGLLGGGTK